MSLNLEDELQRQLQVPHVEPGAGDLPENGTGHVGVRVGPVVVVREVESLEAELHVMGLAEEAEVLHG